MRAVIGRILNIACSLILFVLSTMQAADYFIMTADIPVMFTKKELTTILLLFLLSIIVLAFKIVLVKRLNASGSILLLLAGIFYSVIWSMSLFYNNVAIESNTFISKSEFIMQINGIAVNYSITLSQIINILYYLKKNQNTDL